MNDLILVNEQDEEVGVAAKMEAHQNGMLHRAFSVFIFNAKGELLLQRRALQKYHSGGLWTNTCCSHPAPGADTKDEAGRRLKEEMGFQVPLHKVFEFVYKADFENGLTEYEYDHVFVGEYQGPLNADPHEVMDCCYKPIPEIKQLMQDQPARFTAWFKLAIPKIEEWWNQKYNLAVKE